MTKIGKYLPHIVFIFSTANLTLAVLDFAIWGNLLAGVFNTALATGGFVLAGQLIQRRSSKRSEHLNRRRDVVTERGEVRPRMNGRSLEGSILRDSEAA